MATAAIAAILAGCATTPRPLPEAAVVECEASAETGEVRNCTLISQTNEGSAFGPAAVQTVGRGRLKTRGGEPGWRKFRVTVRETETR
ncbi:hypothetical protein [Brevundimonas faecalis]